MSGQTARANQKTRRLLLVMVSIPLARLHVSTAHASRECIVAWVWPPCFRYPALTCRAEGPRGGCMVRADERNKPDLRALANHCTMTGYVAGTERQRGGRVHQPRVQGGACTKGAYNQHAAKGGIQPACSKMGGTHSMWQSPPTRGSRPLPNASLVSKFQTLRVFLWDSLYRFGKTLVLVMYSLAAGTS